jgi:hypothetical protein
MAEDPVLICGCLDSEHKSFQTVQHLGETSNVGAQFMSSQSPCCRTPISIQDLRKLLAEIFVRIQQLEALQ